MGVQFDDEDSTSQAGTGSVVFDDEQGPKWSELSGNILPNAEEIAKSQIGTTGRILKGINDIPTDALETAKEELQGKSPFQTPIAQDVKTVGQGTLSALEGIPKSLEDLASKKEWIEHPVSNAITAGGLAAPFIGAGKAPAPEEAPAALPKEPLPETPAPEAAPAPAPEVPKDLPVMQPGSKTGDPHALFAYNDTMGPNGAPRSVYNVFGDPNDPAIQKIGHGSSVTKEMLDEAGIPIIGREPRSVGKWEPLDLGKPSQTPPEAQAGPAAGGMPPPRPSGAQRLESAVDDATQKANELKNYISKGYEGYTKKPGALADVADWVQEKSQMMAAQQIGITPNQARQLGRTALESHNAMRAIGQYVLDKDIVSPTTGLSGMLDKNAGLIKSVGKTLGDYREMADKVAGEVDPKEVVAQVKKALDSKYMRTVTNAEGEESSPRGAYGGQAGAYQRALQEVEDAEHSHSGIADAATELNHAANKAAKNMQPETPFTDVANEVSRINNERIKALIGKENAAKYEQALREYGVNKKIANALKFKSSGEVKRFGPGSVMSNLTQKAMDELGYRFGSKAANKLSTAIKNNPSIAGNLPSLFKEFTHQVEDVGHDVTGMYKGGPVPDDVKDYVSKRAC